MLLKEPVPEVLQTPPCAPPLTLPFSCTTGELAQVVRSSPASAKLLLPKVSTSWSCTGGQVPVLVLVRVSTTEPLATSPAEK